VVKISAEERHVLARSWRSFPSADGALSLNYETRPIEPNVFFQLRRQAVLSGLTVRAVDRAAFDKRGRVSYCSKFTLYGWSHLRLADTVHHRLADDGTYEISNVPPGQGAPHLQSASAVPGDHALGAVTVEAGKKTRGLSRGATCARVGV